MKKYRIFILGVLFCMLTACGNNNSIDTITTTAKEGDLTAKEFVISYDTKTYTPNVLINQAGYLVADKKTVYFVGENLSDTFQVLEYGTDFVVFEGKMEETIKDGYYMGNFTELKKQGNFYIQTKKIGESYPFVIEEQEKMEVIYHKLLSNLTSQDITKYLETEKLEELIPVLIAHEMHQTAFLDGDIYFEQNNIPDILDYLDLVGNTIIEKEETNASINDVFLKAAFFAKLSFNLSDYDQTKAKEYQVAAEILYQEAVTQLKEENLPGYESYAYFASAELYRTTGKYSYRTNTEKYGAMIPLSQGKNEFTFYADMTHMSTRKTVQVTFCNERMEALRISVVTWTENSGKYPFFYNLDQEDTLLLYGMKTLWIHEINYSEEYEELEKDIFAYFTGLNTEGVSYISEIGYTISNDAFENNLNLNNKFLVLISRYMQQEEVE